MNIIVIPSAEQVNSTVHFARPDITWERKNEDLYVHEETRNVGFTPVLFTKVSKSGKCISEKFAQRYFESINFGILVYDTDLANGSTYDFALANCMDHTSFLPTPLFKKLTLGQGNEFVIKLNGDTIFHLEDKEEEIIITPSQNKTLQSSQAELPSKTLLPSSTLLEKALTNASYSSYLRIGDFVAVELDEIRPLASRENLSANETDNLHIEGYYCDNLTLDFDIIF